jgi:hypothetical protein
VQRIILTTAALISFTGLVISQLPNDALVPARTFATGPRDADAATTVTVPKLTYLGACKVPPQVSAFSTGGLAWRSKSKTVFMIGHTGEDQPIYELSLPAVSTFSPSPRTAPTATYVKTFPGALFAGRDFPLGTGEWMNEGQLNLNGVLSTRDDRLIVTYGPNYINDAVGAPFALVLSNLDAATPIVAGPYRTANALSHQIAGYGFELGAPWSAAHAPGKTFVFGAGLESGTANASEGPDLWLTGDFGKSLNIGSAVAAIHYPITNWCPVPQMDYKVISYDDRTGTTTTPINTNQFHSPSGGHGWWKTTDFVGGAVAIPDTKGNFAGVLFVANQGYGLCWYGPGTITIAPADALAMGIPGVIPAAGLTVQACNSASKGQTSQHWRSAMWWLPVTDLEAVLAGAKHTWQASLVLIDPEAGTNGLALSCNKRMNGLAYDPATKTLLATAPKAAVDARGAPNNLPLVHAWRVTLPQ